MTQNSNLFDQPYREKWWTTIRRCSTRTLARQVRTRTCSRIQSTTKPSFPTSMPIWQICVGVISSNLDQVCKLAISKIIPCLTFLIFNQSLKLRPKTKSRSLINTIADALYSARNKGPISIPNHLINTVLKHSRYLALSTVRMKSSSQLLSTTTSWTIAPSTFCRESIHDVC